MCELAERQGLVLVTTEKDLARMHGDAETAQLAERVRALPVTLKFEDEAAFRRCCSPGSQRRARRQGRRAPKHGVIAKDQRLMRSGKYRCKTRSGEA